MSIDAGNYKNLKNDASLSLAIGGASGAFVGTDVAYLGGEGNFLRPIVGVEPDMSQLVGCTRAGTSTAIGFAAAQSVENVVWTKGKNWIDPPE